MSDNPSGTLGGLISGLFGGKTTEEGTRTGGAPTRKVVGGALLAAGAVYLYQRYKNGNLNLPDSTPKFK